MKLLEAFLQNMPNKVKLVAMLVFATLLFGILLSMVGYASGGG